MTNNDAFHVPARLAQHVRVYPASHDRFAAYHPSCTCPTTARDTPADSSSRPRHAHRTSDLTHSQAPSGVMLAERASPRQRKTRITRFDLSLQHATLELEAQNIHIHGARTKNRFRRTTSLSITVWPRAILLVANASTSSIMNLAGSRSQLAIIKDSVSIHLERGLQLYHWFIYERKKPSTSDPPRYIHSAGPRRDNEFVRRAVLSEIDTGYSCDAQNDNEDNLHLPQSRTQ